MGMPLALRPEFEEDPDAMFILWKDHTAVHEAAQINAFIKERNLDYLLYEGGTYSSEWVWAKVLHIINTNSVIKDAAYAWVEHCDWMTGLVTGNTIPEQILRSRCAAGHKAMWHESWGLPSGEVLENLNPALKKMLPHLSTNSLNTTIPYFSLSTHHNITSRCPHDTNQYSRCYRCPNSSHMSIQCPDSYRNTFRQSKFVRPFQCQCYRWYYQKGSFRDADIGRRVEYAYSCTSF